MPWNAHFYSHESGGSWLDGRLEVAACRNGIVLRGPCTVAISGAGAF